MKRKRAESSLSSLAAPVCAAALSALVVVPASGQQEASTRLSGVAGITWESSKSEVMEKWGTPVRTESLANGGENLWYEHGALGRGAEVYFMVHPSRGLVKGGYDIPLDGSDDCVEIYNRTVAVLGEPYSENSELDFCRLQDSRMPMDSWKDPRGALIGVYISGGKAHLEFEAQFYEEFATGR